MAVTSIDAVRMKSADRSAITRETGRGDGTAKYFKLGHRSILGTPALEVRIDNVLQVGGYTVDLLNGIVTFTSAPALAAEIEFVYYWSQFSDEELQFFLDESGSNTTLAAAKVLLAVAADASKVAERQSLAGGGGLGAVTIDTSVAARELRATAKALYDSVLAEGDIEPADGLTELNWTEFQFQEGITQNLIRRI